MLITMISTVSPVTQGTRRHPSTPVPARRPTAPTCGGTQSGYLAQRRHMAESGDRRCDFSVPPHRRKHRIPHTRRIGDKLFPPLSEQAEYRRRQKCDRGTGNSLRATHNHAPAPDTIGVDRAKTVREFGHRISPIRSSIRSAPEQRPGARQPRYSTTSRRFVDVMRQWVSSVAAGGGTPRPPSWRRPRHDRNCGRYRQPCPSYPTRQSGLRPRSAGHMPRSTQTRTLPRLPSHGAARQPNGSHHGQPSQNTGMRSRVSNEKGRTDYDVGHFVTVGDECGFDGGAVWPQTWLKTAVATGRGTPGRQTGRGQGPHPYQLAGGVRIVIVAEVGQDMTRSPTAGHLRARALFAPG